jgi:hypothetical protein
VPAYWQEKKRLKHGDSIMRFLSAAGGTGDAGSKDILA